MIFNNLYLFILFFRVRRHFFLVKKRFRHISKEGNFDSGLDLFCTLISEFLIIV